MAKKEQIVLETDRKEPTYIVHPVIKAQGQSHGHALRDPAAAIDEVEGLARAINLDVLQTQSLNLSKITPSLFIGKGQAEELGVLFDELDPSIVVFDHPLSPVQQRNLERAWKRKVIDRTGLILEIFGARAQTKEGRLQVELAALDYQRSRLVRSWTHLERQRGGAGFMGGPGETQIELDRRIIGERITKLKKELEEVRRTRALGRENRARVPFPVVALVGYTNAGKSTLFNQMTKAGVFAEDLPFATLDPTMRCVALGQGPKVILSDTVGFIADLPTHLVEAFRATLEQITYADAIVHIIDASRPDYQAQHDDVVEILKDLGIKYDEDERIIEVWNKADALDQERYEDLAWEAGRFSNKILLSALKGQGVDELRTAMSDVVGRRRKEIIYELPHNAGEALAWLYRHAQVITREDKEEGVTLTVLIDPADKERFRVRYWF